MWYIGLDVHAKQSTYCVLDERGKHLQTRTVKGPWDKVLLELAAIKEPWAVCFEASIGYGVLATRLEKMAQRVVVAHPSQLRLIFRSKRKNDRVDAEKLAKLLFLDEVPTVYVPGVDVRSWRALIQHREGVVEKRTQVKNALRSLLRGQGIVAPVRLWTRQGIAWLQSVELPTAADRLRRDLALEELRHVQQQLKRVEKALKEVAQQHPGVALLMTIPGVGIRTAEAVVAYIDDPKRFARSKAVGSYFGLVPLQDASADKNRLGHITKQGPATVRRLVTEAAWQGIRRSPEVRGFFERVQRNDPQRKKIAVVATAHYLVRVMHAMLRDGRSWQQAA
jgi:transposase